MQIPCFSRAAIRWSVALAAVVQSFSNSAAANGAEVVLLRAEVEDRIRGGMLGQILGNLNGLPHEMKYIHEPGNVTDYVPRLPDGARTDDDTDLEWIYVVEIERRGDPLIPADQIARLWRRHVNEGVWCANGYARQLMELDFEPPLTGSAKLNPWASFNLSGQFVCESFGLMSPAMPQTAARIGMHYTRVAVEGEPLQTTRLFTAMIASAFVEHDVERLLDAGLAAVDPLSEVAAIVAATRDICRAHPDDWRSARQSIKDRWQVHRGEVRDWNGYELNAACTIAALVYGRGDMAETLRIAFNLGWDCDNNAATAATIVGVMVGRQRLDAQDWEIKDLYRNTTRPGMPDDETIASYEDRVLACADIVIRRQGGEAIDVDGEPAYRIVAERAGYVADESADGADAPCAGAIALDPPDDAPETVRRLARAAYLAICCGVDERLARERPQEWLDAVRALASFAGLMREIKAAPRPYGAVQQAGVARWLEVDQLPD